MLLFCSNPSCAAALSEVPTLFRRCSENTQCRVRHIKHSKKKRRDPMKTLTRPENASAANVSHPVEDEISPRREKSESNNARQGRSWERAGSSINGISGFPSRARGKAIRHIFKQQPVRLCRRGGRAGGRGGGLGSRSARGGGICRERLFRGVNCGKQLERLSWRVFLLFFPLHVKRKVPARPRRHKRGTSAY